MRKMRFGIISFAHIHAWGYANVLKELENAELVAIYDDDRQRLLKAAERFGVKNVYDDYEKLLSRDDIDAVIITSENAKHVDQAISAAEHGKHMIVEKPIAVRLDDADKMVNVAKKHDVKFQTAFVMRYHDATLTVKKMLEEGNIGDILVITTTNHGKYPDLWFAEPELSGGGSMIDHTVHTADLMRWYTKDEVAEVYAIIGEKIRKELKAEDTGLISLKFRNGVVGSIDCSWSRHDTWPIWGDVWLGIIGTEGYIVIDAFRPNVELVVKGKPLVWQYFGSNADKNMILDFIRVVDEDLEPRASGWDGRQALEITLAAYKSANSGMVIKLPL
ncbi:MAG: Gfo/Idh/MocA family oxidoreductase [Thermoproteales archaeon]|nr:Gfo/Idh/MocA family oxidoreductase [Thermoproteales archaeon]